MSVVIDTYIKNHIAISSDEDGIHAENADYVSLGILHCRWQLHHRWLGSLSD